MKKNLIIFFSLFINSVYSQKEINGKSSTVNFKMQMNYERGLPPNLFVNLDFEDDNGNGILEAEESAVLKLKISNKGKGPAQKLLVSVVDDFYDPNFKINDKKEISVWIMH